MLAAVLALYDLVDQLDENLLEGDGRELRDGREASAPVIGEARSDAHDTNGDSSYNEVSHGDSLISSVADSCMRYQYGTTLSSNNRLAIQDQLRVQLHHILPRLLPSLHQVDHILKDFKLESSPDSDLEEFSSLLDRLCIRLRTKFAGGESKGSSLDHVSVGAVGAKPSSPLEPIGELGNLFGRTLSLKGRISDGSTTLTYAHVPPNSLRPPSPEARQRRKTSYGVF